MPTHPPSPRQLKEAQMRVQRVRQFITAKFGNQKTWNAAAREAGVSVATAWRWLRALEKHGPAGLIPKVSAGRQGAAERYQLPTATLRRLANEACRLGSAQAAWRKFAQSVDCPLALAKQINAGRIPPSLIAATRPQVLKVRAVRSAFGETFITILDQP